jgi:hypothetical protein
MTEPCPTCGQPLPPRDMIVTAEALVAAMKVPPPPSDGKFWRGHFREVYEAERGEFHLTYGGQVSPEAVADAITRGLIVPSYPDGSIGCWSVPAGAAEIRRRHEELQAKRKRRADPR